MHSIAHDPAENIQSFQQLLVSDKKKVAFLFGAGTSLAGKWLKIPYVPAIDELTIDIITSLSISEEYKVAFSGIREEIEAANGKFNIESILTILEQKKQAIGKGNLNGLCITKITELIRAC